MADFYEIDFLDVETSSSGDAICLRYTINGFQYIHVVDGGFQDTGSKIVDHINNLLQRAATSIGGQQDGVSALQKVFARLARIADLSHVSPSSRRGAYGLPV